MDRIPRSLQEAMDVERFDEWQAAAARFITATMTLRLAENVGVEAFALWRHTMIEFLRADGELQEAGLVLPDCLPDDTWEQPLGLEQKTLLANIRSVAAGTMKAEEFLDSVLCGVNDG